MGIGLLFKTILTAFVPITCAAFDAFFPFHSGLIFRIHARFSPWIFFKYDKVRYELLEFEEDCGFELSKKACVIEESLLDSRLT